MWLCFSGVTGFSEIFQKNRQHTNLSKYEFKTMKILPYICFMLSKQQNDSSLDTLAIYQMKNF